MLAVLVLQGSIKDLKGLPRTYHERHQSLLETSWAAGDCDELQGADIQFNCN